MGKETLSKLSRKHFFAKVLAGLTGFLGLTFFVKQIFGKTNHKGRKQMMNGEGILLTKPLGFVWETKDPFLFCAYHFDKYPQANGKFGPKASLKGRNIGQDFEPKDGWRMYHGEEIPGFPGHPHRGFETVTVVQKGIVDHSDSLGASGRYGNGDVQWMTAGKGIQHAEMFPLIDENTENPLELFQIWLNLPSRSKMVDPFYKMFWSEDIPFSESRDENGKLTKIKLIAGSLGKEKAIAPPPNSWASPADNHVAIWVIDMEPEAQMTLSAARAELTRVLYYYEGKEADFNGRKVPSMNLIDLVSDQEVKIVNGNQGSKILLLQGKPLREPVAQYGPFVMNTQSEIQQAFYDYQKTRFGGWPWSSSEPVHGNKGRFSKYADGTEESRT
jgi:quercetin 2,3-dioxygenase